MTFLSVRARLVVVALTVGVVGGLAAPVSAQPWREDPVEVVTLSNRADLISGGDALVEVVLPERVEGDGVEVTANGRDVTESFAVRDDGRFYGRVEGLQVGTNRITATVPDGSGAYLDVGNHPVGGPVFSGPQVWPWLCETEAAGLGPPQDQQCNAPTVYEFFYMPQTGGGFQTYDPDDPPPDGAIATTTTDEGETVPYIVRRERGTINRAIYDIAVLFDPEQEWEPWKQQVGWNGKLYYLFEGGAAPNHRQGSAPSDVLRDMPLSRGFAVATATLNIFGQNTNSVTSAETVMMVKERLVEQFGEIRYTMSTGCSGGSIQQQLIANAYPGLLDGIEPSCSYMDIYTTNVEATDCSLLDRYYNETSPHLWAIEQQRAAVNGHADIGPCHAWDDAFNLDQTWMDPRVGCLGGTVNPGATAEEPDYVYDPETNPDGVRCNLHDYQVAMFGRRPPEAWGPVEQQIGRGFTSRPFDNVGVQYGLGALQDGEILPEQFVDLNEQVGGYDIDYGWQSDRSAADPFALEVAYRTGQVNDAAQLDRVPMIDLRGSSNHEIHTDFRSWVMRARLEQANGHHDNQVIWSSPRPLMPDSESATQAFGLMDAWLAAIEADTSEAPLAEKVVGNKPEEAVDACWIGGQKVTDQDACAAAVPYFADPRIAAGGPFTDDVLKCQLKPLDRADYDVEFTDGQWQRLQEAFPDGVCDYSQPGVGQQESTPWLAYLSSDGSAIPGGEPLGDPPVSVPFGPEGASALVARHAGPTRIETAVAVGQLGIESADTVVVARADEFPDALAGSPLAVALDAPLLLSSSDSLSPAVAQEVERLGATDAVLLGGESALAPEVAADLEDMGVAVRRVAGSNRFATAAAIAGELGGPGEVLVARGDGFADALSASALGAAAGIPVLLVAPDRLPEETAAALGEDVDATVVGGTAAVSEAVAAQVDAGVEEVSRLAGSTRYATSAAVADEAVARGMSPVQTWVATGTDFPDALVAGVAAGRDGHVLVLVDGASLNGSPETREWLAGHSDRVEVVRIAGGIAAVADAVEDALAAML